MDLFHANSKLFPIKWGNLPRPSIYYEGTHYSTTMNSNIFPNNIWRYILRGNDDGHSDTDIDIDDFVITKFDYRKVFCGIKGQNIIHLEIVSKFFGIDKMTKVNIIPSTRKLYYGDNPDKWKELFIFFCVMPFTEYEFEGQNGELINPGSLHNACPSDATDNFLIGTFSDIEFESLNQEIEDDRLAANLQLILKMDIFSNKFSEDQRDILIPKLLDIAFNLDYERVDTIPMKAESTYKNNFMNFLFKPISNYVAALLCFEIKVEEENTNGQTGVHTRVPNTRNDLFKSHPDIVAYAKKMHCRSLAIVEVKRIPLLSGTKSVDFKGAKMNDFLVQVIAEMFSNHTNKGILTDSYTTILVEMDIQRSLNAIRNNMEVTDGKKSVALNYKVLDCHSWGLTLRGGLISFVYEAFNQNEAQLNEIKRGLDEIYRYIRKTDEEYLRYLDKIANKYEQSYKSFCKDVYRAKGQYLHDTVISLGEFADIDVQSGFTFNSQVFKVRTMDIKKYLKEGVSAEDQLIVKVFDPIKAKRDHDSYRVEKSAIFDKCRRAYLCEKAAHEMLRCDARFNSIYVNQECVFGKFNIGHHYHAMGPFIVLKYLDHTKCPMDEETYKKAEEQLTIIHYHQIIHGDISLRNILYCEGKVYFIDFGFSNYDDYHDMKGKRSRPVSANEESKKSEHRDLCEIFGQPIPEKYTSLS